MQSCRGIIVEPLLDESQHLSMIVALTEFETWSMKITNFLSSSRSGYQANVANYAQFSLSRSQNVCFVLPSTYRFISSVE